VRRPLPQRHVAAAAVSLADVLLTLTVPSRHAQTNHPLPSTHNPTPKQTPLPNPQPPNPTPKQTPTRLPQEPESAALGAALQAGAVHSGARVADFVARHEPPVSDAVVRPTPGSKAPYAEAYARHVALGAQLFAPPQRQ